MIQIVVDGGCLGNGTDRASMYGSAKIGERYYAWDFGPGGTNNQAEYLALFEALSVAKSESGVLIFTDSELVRNQVNGAWRIKDPELRGLVFRIRELLSHFASWEIQHMPECAVKLIFGH